MQFFHILIGILPITLLFLVSSAATAQRAWAVAPPLSLTLRRRRERAFSSDFRTSDSVPLFCYVPAYIPCRARDAGDGCESAKPALLSRDRCVQQSSLQKQLHLGRRQTRVKINGRGRRARARTATASRPSAAVAAVALDVSPRAGCASERARQGRRAGLTVDCTLDRLHLAHSMCVKVRLLRSAPRLR